MCSSFRHNFSPALHSTIGKWLVEVTLFAFVAVFFFSRASLQSHAFHSRVYFHIEAHLSSDTMPSLTSRSNFFSRSLDGRKKIRLAFFSVCMNEEINIKWEHFKNNKYLKIEIKSSLVHFKSILTERLCSITAALSVRALDVKELWHYLTTNIMRRNEE